MNNNILIGTNACHQNCDRLCNFKENAQNKRGLTCLRKDHTDRPTDVTGAGTCITLRLRSCTTPSVLPANLDGGCLHQIQYYNLNLSKPKVSFQDEHPNRAASGCQLVLSVAMGRGADW